MGNSERGGRGSGSYEFRPGQSIPSMFVDLACIGAVVYLAIKGVREPAVWSILSGLMIGRFGVSHSKTMERSNRGGDGGGGSGNWGRRDLAPILPTEERDPRTYPRPIPREDPPRRARLSARQRLAAWIERRRAAPSMPWWTRRAVSIPLTSFRVDAMSLAVLVVLIVAIATLATVRRSSASPSSSTDPVDETNGATARAR